MATILQYPIIILTMQQKESQKGSKVNNGAAFNRGLINITGKYSCMASNCSA